MTAPLLDDVPPRPDQPPVRRRPRVRRLPPYEPPYEDEWSGQVLVLPGQDELPFEEPPPRRFDYDIDFFDPQPTPRRDLPPPDLWATRFLRAVLEALAGVRASAQLVEWTSPSVHARIGRVAQGRRWSAQAGRLPTIRSVRVGEPADGVAEVCAVVQRGTGCAAVAARLEGFDGRWRCVALELG